MTRKIKKQITDGWADESLSPRALKLINELSDYDDPTLHVRIGKLVGDFRLKQENRDTASPPEVSKEHVAKTGRAVTYLLAQLELMPEDFKSLASVKFLEHRREDYEQTCYRMESDLKLYIEICSDAVETMDNWKNRGERKKSFERNLLAGVAALLKPYSDTSAEAAKNASEVLRAAGIKRMPVDKKVAARHARTARQKS